MSKKRAFIRYTKSGKIVPGSLIVTTKGGYPKDGIYKEVGVYFNDSMCPPSGLTCTLWRYDGIPGEPVGTLSESVICAGGGYGDMDFSVGEIKCVQFFGSAYPDIAAFTNLGPCNP